MKTPLVPRPRLRPGPRVPAVRTVVGHICGIVFVVCGLGMLASGVVELIDGGPERLALFLPGGVFTLGGAALWRTTTLPPRLQTASIFAAVLASWLALSVAGAIPFLLSGVLDRPDDALFESISGFTTTGSTVIRPIEGVSKGILFWRAVTQWIGGIGVVVFAVSVLPFLGVGGMELLDAEAPGPSSERLAPRLRETAKRLVSLYLGFTIAVVTLYVVFGMSLYDGVAHAFTTVSTGGFSPYNASFAEFDSAALEWVSVAAMIFAGGNFALYWRALSGRTLRVFRAPEFRAYVVIMTFVAGVAVAWNVAADGWSHDLVRQTIFSVISLSSSTGYTMLDYDAWAGGVQLALIFAMGLGGMAGSTTGGFKVFRLQTVLAYARRQVFRQLHPRSVDVVRVGSDVVAEPIAARVVGFFGLFMAVGGLATFAVAATGTDPVTAISAVATSIGNVGPGLGEVGPTTDFLNLTAPARGVLMVVMLMGRLEIFPVLLGFVPLARFVGTQLPRRVTSKLRRIASG